MSNIESAICVQSVSTTFVLACRGPAIKVPLVQSWLTSQGWRLRKERFMSSLKSMYALAKLKRNIKGFGLRSFKEEALQVYEETCQLLAEGDQSRLRQVQCCCLLLLLLILPKFSYFLPASVLQKFSIIPSVNTICQYCCCCCCLLAKLVLYTQVAVLCCLQLPCPYQEVLVDSVSRHCCTNPCLNRQACMSTGMSLQNCIFRVRGYLLHSLFCIVLLFVVQYLKGGIRSPA